MKQFQDSTGLARFGADLMRAACGLELSEDDHQDAAHEGFGTLMAQGIAAEIAVDTSARERRAVREALAETQVALHRPGRVFDAA